MRKEITCTWGNEEEGVKAANIIKKALAQGRTALNEHESKQLLAAYGVPVVHEAVANDAVQAVELAHSLGYPVVLKGLGSTLLHKTERGLVHLNLSTKAAVERAVLPSSTRPGTSSKASSSSPS